MHQQHLCNIDAACSYSIKKDCLAIFPACVHPSPAANQQPHSFYLATFYCQMQGLHIVLQRTNNLKSMPMVALRTNCTKCLPLAHSRFDEALFPK